MSETIDVLATTNEESNFCFADNQPGDPAPAGSKISCSSVVGWTSLRAETFDYPATVEPFETAASPDHTIFVNLEGEYEIESFSGRSWKKAFYRRGFGGLTVAGKTDRLRWEPKNSNRHTLLCVHIPQFFFRAAREEYRRAGVAVRLDSLNSLCFHDPIIWHVGLALNAAVRAGAPNLYAESAAQFLTTHLLSTHGKLSKLFADARNPGALTDRRLRRVIDFMQHRFHENLTLAELAREAGISRFHFVNLFKNACGITPHRYLIELRVNHAAELLINTDYSVDEIAVKCGYASANNLAAAFQKQRAQTPAAYRKKCFAARRL